MRLKIDAWLAQRPDRVEHAAAASRAGALVITRSRITRTVCDGLAVDPEPYVHTRANVRASLVRAAIHRDWVESRERSASEVVAAVWSAEASRRPGDPSSASAWMNAQAPTDAVELRLEVTELVEGFRRVWPLLDDTVVAVAHERHHEVEFCGGRVRLTGRPDVVIDSRRRDARARGLVIDLRAGRPRPDQDRQQLRFHALLVALATGVPPFRWATYYVTEGRYEIEDLDAQILSAAADRVLDAVEQQMWLAGATAGSGGARPRIRGGDWCRDCARRRDCPSSTVGPDSGAAGDVAPV